MDAIFFNYWERALSESREVKFDLIITNPPFGNDPAIKTIGSKKLYQSFAKKAFELVVPDGLVMMITPHGWFSPSRKSSNFLQSCRSNKKIELLVSGDHLKEHFKKVGSSICYWIIKNNSAPNPMYDLPFLPVVINRITLSITAKLLIGPRLDIINGGSEHQPNPAGRKSIMSKHEDEFYFHPSFHTNVQALFASKPHSLQYENKVIWTLSGEVKPFYDQGILGIGPVSCAILTNKPVPVISILRSKLFQWIFDNWKWSGFQSYPIHMQYLPAVDFNRSWTDQELYQHFGLTEEEIDAL